MSLLLTHEAWTHVSILTFLSHQSKKAFSTNIFSFCSLQIKAAVYLNNTGIHLLKNRCHRQGMETLADFVAIMTKNTGGCTLGCSHLCSLKGEDSAVNIPDMLERGAKRLANPAPSKAQNWSCARVIIVSDKDSMLEGTRTCFKQNPILIRIDPIDDDDYRQENLAVMCSIALYNYAIAFSCLSSLSSSEPFVEKLDAGAFHLLLMANTADELPLNSSAAATTTKVWSPWNRALLMKWLILCRLVVLTRKDRRCSRTKAYRPRFSGCLVTSFPEVRIIDSALACGLAAQEQVN